ncbi:phosphopyruvate hydratase [Candidatus Dependentiae bacterium]|nr:MAG: phosphopyruvate hydratase [Candidatus Dependentiae bacterium]
MKIKQVIGHEIFDSRGYPTIECEITLEDGQTVRASVPSGISRGKYEAVELRDGGSRLCGLGVSKAIEKLETVIAPEIIDKEPNVVDMDLKMIEMDGTQNKEKLGANSTLAVSTAITKAQAISSNIKTYELIAQLCGLEQVSLPYPLCNIINGGLHADNNLQVQEIMISPIGFSTFREAFEAIIEIYHCLKKILRKQGKSTLVGDEGGFAANFEDETEALDLLMQAIEMGSKGNGNFVIALDVAASHFYDHKTKTYQWHNRNLTAKDMIELYDKLSRSYPIYSIEDGLSEDDWEGWKLMMKKLGNRLQIVGDDLFATNPARIAEGIEQHIANTAIIKPTQIGTITETLQAVLLCKDYGLNTIVSHRSGETEDTFIVDFAVGTSSGQMKIGGCSRGERIAKYNQMLRIEDALHLRLLNE